MKDLFLNYQELAFIADIPVSKSKELFKKKLENEKPKVKDEIKVSDLMDSFQNIKSVDARYDGINELLFYLEHKKQLYKRFLNDKPTIKRKKFTGGKSIFYKILSKDELKSIDENLNFKNNYLYGKSK